tara:strand:+ start:262 stop:1461 length:1200 start_codon:yes stop_codon:yes gene_type:complete
MKFLLTFLILLASASQSHGQQNPLSTDYSWKWFDMYYGGDSLLKSQLITFYALLYNVENEKDIEELFYQQADLADELSYSVDLSRSYNGGSDEDELSEAEKEEYAYYIYQANMEDAIVFLNDIDIPGFDFGCAAECTEFDVSVDYSIILDAARKTISSYDDIGITIITDVWGIHRDYVPSFQSVECCSCPGFNALGSGEQYALLMRIKKYQDRTNLFSDELEMIKNTMANYIVWNDGFRAEEDAVSQEFELILPLIDFSEEAMMELYKKEPFYKYKLNYSIKDGQFFVNKKPIPPGCIAQLKTELNGDNSQASIYLERNSLRGCMDSNIPFPGGNEQKVSYSIDETLINDTYFLTVTEYIDGSMGSSQSRIIVQFVNKNYTLKDGSKINVLSLDKIGEW